MANRKGYRNRPIYMSELCCTCTRYRLISAGEGNWYDACHNNTRSCRYSRRRKELTYRSEERAGNLREMQAINERRKELPF